MSDFVVLPIDPVVVDRLRKTNDLGRAAVPYRADGSEPLRCCLEDAGAGETVLVVSYSPTPVDGPWQEVGPIARQSSAPG